jgi:hypothetical protein
MLLKGCFVEGISKKNQVDEKKNPDNRFCGNTREQLL